MIHVDIGFTPVNNGWNSSTLDIGLFYMNTGQEGDNEDFASSFFTHSGCSLYSDAFNINFIEGDRTWLVAVRL